MASRVPDWKRRFVMVGRDFPTVLLGSRVLMRLVPGIVLGAACALLYLDAKPSHVGADVDGLACCLHHPMNCG
jgi:hypothetical protein